LGVFSLPAALDLARARNVDLVEVAPKADPPVCKLLDFGRFQFEQTKREREAKKGQKAFTLKEIRFRPNVGEHDIEVKTKLIKQFLSEGDKVKVTVRLRGRELAHPERASMLLDALATRLAPHPTERPAQADARSRMMIVAPLKAATPKRSEAAPEPEPVGAPPS
jgi:translation initiation factor IF-3